MDKTKWFCETGSECHTLKEEFVKAYNGKLYPATKEQRDTLFAKMKEAGYDWDAEKKELKKINKNTDVGHEYFSELLENNDSKDIDDYAYQCAYCMSHDWLKDTPTWDDVETACKLGAKWNEKHHKSAWSEEDMSKVQRICKYLDEAKKYYADINEVRECMDWLKSIKDRVQPIHEYSETEKQEIFIRSQRPYFWRPSDEQMEALKGVQEGVFRLGILESLYNDLKKLKS